MLQSVTRNSRRASFFQRKKVNRVARAFRSPVEKEGSTSNSRRETRQWHVRGNAPPSARAHPAGPLHSAQHVRVALKGGRVPGLDRLSGHVPLQVDVRQEIRPVLQRQPDLVTRQLGPG